MFEVHNYESVSLDQSVKVFAQFPSVFLIAFDIYHIVEYQRKDQRSTTFPDVCKFDEQKVF